MYPSPWHLSHLPPGILKENLPFSYPLALANSTFAYKSLISSNTDVYVAGLDLGVFPIGDCDILTILSKSERNCYKKTSNYYSWVCKRN